MPAFGDVARDLVYSVHIYRGDAYYPIVSASHACTPPRLLPTRPVAPPLLLRRVPLPLGLCPPRPPPRSGTEPMPPRLGGECPIAPAGVGHALARLVGPAGSDS